MGGAVGVVVEGGEHGCASLGIYNFLGPADVRDSLTAWELYAGRGELTLATRTRDRVLGPCRRGAGGEGLIRVRKA